MWRARMLHAIRQVHHAHRVLDGDALQPRVALVLLGPAEAG